MKHSVFAVLGSRWVSLCFPRPPLFPLPARRLPSFLPAGEARGLGGDSDVSARRSLTRTGSPGSLV